MTDKPSSAGQLPLQDPRMADFRQIQLETKPGASISYRFHGASRPESSPHLVVFVNGLGLPQISWSSSIEKLKELRASVDIPAMLTYDRFGQGQTTDRDPLDQGATDPMHGHDCLDVVRDMRQLITQVTKTHMGRDVDDTEIILVCNSIGGAISRLYAQEHPYTVSGILFLDSVLANTDFISIFPDPDERDFKESSLPAGITSDALRQAREKVLRTFHPDVGSREGLSRRNLRTLLPHSDRPVIKSRDDNGPWITVIGHDFEAFAKESTMMGQPENLTKEYVNPFWHTYNEGLAKLTENPDRSRGPIQAPGAGHFIQKDSPELVANELNQIINGITVGVRY